MPRSRRTYGSSFLQALYYAPYDSTGCFAYAHSVIGSTEDLDAAQLADVQEFFAACYMPNNATLAVVGAFDAAEARGLIADYFGAILAGTPPPPVECRDPFRGLPLWHVEPDPNATLPALVASYGAVRADHADSRALTLLGSILGEGESSRLHQRLVREEQARRAPSQRVRRPGAAQQ